MNKEKPTTDSPFPNPWFIAFYLGPKLRTLAEWAIYDILKTIREKPNWQTKYKDEAIFNKWKEEFRSQISEDVMKTLSKDGIDEIFDYIKKDLEWFELYPSKQTDFENFNIEFDHMICSSETAISKELQKELQQQSDILYKLFDQLDYHPNSDDKVVDLVHPSLYLLQYGKTPVIKDGKVEILEFDKDKVSKVKHKVDIWGISSKFQWIPSVFELKDGKYTIASYINNLHPDDYKNLYGLIEDVFNASIPGLNYTLSRYITGLDNRIEYPEAEDLYTKEYQDMTKELYEKDWDDVEWEEHMEKRPDYAKKLDLTYKPPKDGEFNLNKFDNLKVIVKLANIELTPEKPTYDGGSWHIEGCINEDIVATILYYYDVENITESKLSFKMAFDDPSYEQGDDFYCKYLFDLKDEDTLNRYLGSVSTSENKLLIFPNGYQHHVDPFELKDKTKPGHRKILCFFLVDPYNDVVVSSKDVPPQQPEKKWRDLIDQDISKQIEQLNLDNYPMSLEEAKKVRVEFMEERGKPYQEDPDCSDMPYIRLFSLCEH